MDRNRERLKEWLPWLDLNREEPDSLKFIESKRIGAEKRECFNVGIYRRGHAEQGPVLCGVAALNAVSAMNRSTSIGYWVGDEFLGAGLARLATSALIDFAFGELKLHRVEIRCATGNLRSQRIPEALGFRFEGIARECEWLYDRFVDHRVYARLSTDRR